MPKIRKKTSRRGTTHQRARIKHKVSESHRKAKKNAKKDPQWKSKHKKDPGIPNSFPFKEELLAEVAEERRQATEEKQRKKDERKAFLKSQKLRPDEASLGGSSDTAGLDEGSNDIEQVDQRSGPSDQSTHERLLKNSECMDMESVLERADIVLQVLDARDPQSCRSSYMEEYLSQRKDRMKLFLVLNKIDMCSRENVRSWVTHLRKFARIFIFRSALAFTSQTKLRPRSTGLSGREQSVNDALGVESLMTALQQEATNKSPDPLNVAVVGIGNVGKSSLINSLLKESVCPVYTDSSSYQGPSTTHCAQIAELNLDGCQIYFVDTPSLLWNLPSSLPMDEQKKIKAHDLLLLNKGRIDKIKDPSNLLTHIISRANHEELMVFYNLPAYLEGDVNAFLMSLARSRALLKKGSDLDLSAAARIVLRDWGSEKFPRQTEPPLSDQSAQYDTTDEDIFIELKTQKELRSSTGIIKLKTGDIEQRQPILDVTWERLITDQKRSSYTEDTLRPEAEEDANIQQDILDETTIQMRSKRSRQLEGAPVGSSPTKKVTFSRLPPSSRKAPGQSNANSKSAKTANKRTNHLISNVNNRDADEIYDFNKYF